MMKVLPTHLAHAFEDEAAVVIHARRATAQRGWKNGGKTGGLIATEIAGRDLVVIVGSGVCSVNSGPPFDDVEIELENTLLSKDKLRDGHKRELGSFAEDGTTSSEEDVFHELLGDGGCTASSRALQIVFSSNLNLVPVETVVLIEAGVLRSDDCMLEFGRDLCERNEVVVFVIRSAMDDGLEMPLHVHDGCGWIDPA